MTQCVGVASSPCQGKKWLPNSINQGSRGRPPYQFRENEEEGVRSKRGVRPNCPATLVHLASRPVPGCTPIGHAAGYRPVTKSDHVSLPGNEND